MMPATVVLSPVGGSGQQFFDNNGQMLSGGLIYTYAAGTTNPLATYTDSSGTIQQTNPVVLDADGRVGGGIWLVSGSSYKLVVKTSGGVTLGTWDNILLYSTSVLNASVSANTTLLTSITTGRSSFRANRSGALTWTAGMNLIFDNVVYDNLGEYNSTTGIWTPTVSGKYLISTGCGLSTNQNDGSQFTVKVLKNSSLVRSFTNLSQGGATPVQISGCDIFKVTAGEQYQINITGAVNPSTVIAADSATWFAADYLGP